MMELTRSRRDGKGRFQNPVPTSVGGPGMIFKVLPLYLSNRAETEPKRPLGPFRTDPAAYAAASESGLRVTWFGHSQLLVEIDGVRVLIDPVWERRASPLQWMGPERFWAPPLELEDLPRLDAVLVSHDHYDHLGRHSIGRLARSANGKDALYVTGLGVGARLEQFGVPAGRVAELDWTDSVEIEGANGARIRIAAWPSRHFSGRTAWDRFKTLWGAYVLEGPQHRVYFGADSGAWDGFEAIAARYDGFDLTMLEIGAFHPLWAAIHLGPDGAAAAYRAMGGPERAGALMPIHWGLFNLALHGWREPMERMSEIARSEGWKLWSPTPGEPTEFRDGTWPESRWWLRTP